MEGADWQGDHLVLNEGQTNTLVLSQITWRKRTALPFKDDLVNIPVYFDRDQHRVLFSVNLEAGSDLTQGVVSQRGVCMRLR